MATSITLTGNFWATCRAFTFSDGGGISWAFDQNTNVLTGTVGAGANISLEDLTDVSVTPAQGDILYYNGTDWTELTPGTSGQYLETLGTSANPVWSTVSVTVSAGTGLSGGGSVSAGGSVTLANAGVTSNVAGTGISVSGATGAVTIANTGVTSAVAGTNITVSGATGAVTINCSLAAANPSGTIGLSAVNGSATTWMRSDAAPALSQSIAPTMTGNWTFNGSVTLSGTTQASSSQAANGIGYMGFPRNAQSANYSLAASDRGGYVEMDSTGHTITIPDNVFAGGDQVLIVMSASGTVTIAEGSGLTLLYANGTTSSSGNRTLTGYGAALVLFQQATVAFILNLGGLT